MTSEDDSDAHTLGLLVDLRDLCTPIGEEHHRMASQLHNLLRPVQNPNVHGLNKELTHRVEHLDGRRLNSGTKCTGYFRRIAAMRSPAPRSRPT
jgi:hypothetical protein